LCLHSFYPETKGLALEEVDALFAKNDEVRSDMRFDDGKVEDLEKRVETVESPEKQ
jgi:hypothetical protein